MSSLQANPRLLCTFNALQMSLFPMAVITIYYRLDIGMSMAQIFMLQGAFGLAMALFEFPSGYLADRIGYRRTLIFAALLNAVGWSLYVRADSIGHILLAEVVLGIGISLISGTDSALLYESLEETGQEAQFGMWNGRVKFFGQAGEGTAAIIAGSLYVFWHRLPFLLEVVIWIVNFFVAWRLVEPARHRPPATENWKQIKGMFHHMAVGDKQLRAIVFITIVLGMSSFIPVWTIQLYGTDLGLSTMTLGFVWAIANYSVAISSLYSSRVSAKIGLHKLILLCILLIAVGYGGLGLSHVALGVGFYFILTVMRGLHGPSLHHEEQRRIPSSDRAGFGSLRSLLFRSTFLIISPAIGYSMDKHGQHPVLLVIGCVVVVLALFGLRLMVTSGALASKVPGQPS
ncbi:MAG: MFS family permease [Planctomycetota bacterium]|jgi:MFS family permease